MSATETRPAPLPRSAFGHFTRIETRWADNDVYGHVNNVTYYAFFDTAVNRYLIETGALDLEKSAEIGLVVETRCNYFAPLSFPEPVEAAIAVERLGGSSITYRIGIFAEGAQETAAHGRFVHVYVDRETRRPVPVPDAVRKAVAPLVAAG